MATTLSAGDIAIIGFNFDNPDELSFVLLKDITSGTEISFTDNGWQSSGEFRANEGTFTWTATSDLSKGTVITPTVSGVAFSGAGDQIIAYQGSSDNPTFIYALNSEGSGVWQADATSANTSALPTGLTNGETAVALDEIDNAVYTGTTSGTKAELLAAIGNKDNWSGSNSEPQTLPADNFTVSGGTQALVINEVLGSTTGDDVEYIELFGEPGTSLDGHSIIVVESDAGSSNGTIDKQVDLGPEDVIGDNGFFLIGNSLVEGAYAVTPDKEIESNFVENSSYTIALVETSSITGSSVSGSEVVVDAVGVTDGDAGDTFFFNAPVLGPDGNFLPAGVRRVENGVNTNTAADWVLGDFNLGSDNTPTAGAGDNGGDGEEPTEAKIGEIQGAAHTSPLNGELVTTTGVVTAVDTNGFYLQDAMGDGDDATSDAIFVFTGSAPTVIVGNSVEVTGTVSEFFPGGESTGNLSTTQISNPTITIPDVSIQVFPTPVVIGAGGRVPPNQNIDDDAFGTIADKGNFDPETDGIDFFESIEGMLVTAQDAVAVSPTNRFGEIFTVVDNGTGATGISDRGTLNISPDDFNPEKVQIDEDSGVFDFDFPDVNVGAKLGDVTGVVGYSFGNFEIYPTEDFTGNIVESTIEAETTTIEGSADKLTVASYNVLNLDPNDADGDTDVANGRFDAIASQIVNNLKTPDIIGLQEVQDNNGSEDAGVTSADQTLQQLVDAISAAGGPTYEFIDNTFIGNDTSGGQPVGNIRTAFLYNTDRVALVEDSVESIQDSDQQTNNANPFFDARLPIVAKFTFNGEEVTVVNNHFSSKGGSSPILGVEQPFEARQEEVAVNGSLDERQAQSQAVKDYTDAILAANPSANVVVLGDLNEFEFVSPVKTLAENLTNLTETVSEDERYSFNFQGNSQSLDHILVSDNLADKAEFDIVHVNSEFAETTQRASDHDPLVASLSFSKENMDNINLSQLGTFTSEDGAEIVAHDPTSQRLFVTTGDTIEIIDISNPANPTKFGEIDVTSIGAGANSVAVMNGIVAVAVEANTETDNGVVAFYDADGNSLGTPVTVGVLPDMLTFTPDGNKVIVANEGQPNDDYTVDPEGSISIIDISTGVGSATVMTADFTGFNDQKQALMDGGVRIFGPGATVAQDLEPEYIAVSPDGSQAFVTLQENNAVAVLDIATATVTDILPLGEKDHSLAGNELDASNRDGGINIQNHPVFGLYQPDAIASFEANGQTYYITANEGDARDYDGFSEEARVKDLTLDPTVFPDAATLQQDENLGRLKTTTTLGDTDGDGDVDKIYSYGGRSFSIWDANGNLVFDSGDEIAQITASQTPELFNANDGVASEFDERSDDKGAEPESVTVGVIGGKPYAFVGLERAGGGVLVYNLSDPTAPEFTQYIRTEGDIAPEGLKFIAGEDSSNGQPMLAVANEVSNTTTLYEIEVPSYTLQLLHAADQEGGIPALEDAPNFSAVLNALKNEDADGDGNVDYENTLTLSSGDAYIPGTFQDASADESLGDLLGKEGVGRADIAIQNELGFQAIALGNHEFDLGTEFVASVIAPDEGYPGASFPYLSANLDVSTDENLAPLVTDDGQEASDIAGKIAKSAIVTVNGEKIGVVGATTPTLASISSPGDVTVKPEDSADIDALAAEIQTSVDALLAANPELDKVVLLSHMQQISIEEELATKLKNVDIIMAGGSNTLLSDDTDRLRDGDESQGVYPIVKTDADGKPVAVINTDGNYKYVGRLVVDFDANGNIIPESIDPNVSGAYATDDAGVAAVNGTPDAEIVAITEALSEVIIGSGGNFFGITDVFLNGTRSSVRTEETNLGNLTADANLAIAKQADPSVMVSIKNGGGIRDNIGRVVTPAGSTEPEFLPPEANELAGKPEGGISQVDIQDTLRFNNGLTLLTATAEELLAIIEHGVAETEDGATPGRFPQVSGLKFSFDDDLPAGERVQSLAVVDENGEIIDVVAKDGELQGDANREIRLVTLNFLAGGGDGFPFPDRDVVELAQEDTAPRTGAATFAEDGSEQDALAEYLQANFSEENPFSEEDVAPELDMRIQNLDFREDTVFIEEVVTGGDTDDTVSGSENNDFIDAGAGNDDIDAGAGNDVIEPGEGNDIVDAGPGDDTIKGGQGDNQIDGGEGIDTVSYDGNQADFTIEKLADGSIKVGSNTDTLTNVEFLEFSDGTISTSDIASTSTNKINLTQIGTFTSEDGAEIVAHDPTSQRLFVTTGDTIEIIDISNPASPSKFGEIDVTSIGDGANSVAVKNGIVAIAVEANTSQDNGVVAFYDADGNSLGTPVTVGALPDMLTFTPDGMKVIVANEGEPNDDYTVDPEGSISIIDISGGVAGATVMTAGFAGFNDQKQALINKGVRIFGPNATVAQDLEPEYIAVSADGSTAVVTLQENNAVAVVDIATATVQDVLPLGFKDHSKGQPSLTQYEFSNLPVLGTTEGGQDILLGGLSGLHFDGTAPNGNLKFVTVPDRGPNGNSSDVDGDGGNERPFALPDYQARVVTFELNEATGQIENLREIALTRQDGVTPITGRPNIEGVDEEPVDLSGNPLTYDEFGADLEGVVINPADGSYWMVDEYRPAIYNFDFTGKLINRYVPEGTAALAGETAGTFGTESLPAELSTRRPNRGFEAVALDTDNQEIYAFIQTPLANPDRAASDASDVICIVVINSDGQAVAKYVYLLEDPAVRDGGRVDKIGDAVYVGDGKFKVIERDSAVGENAKKFIFDIDLKGATNLLAADAPALMAGKTLEQHTADELVALGINPVQKTKVTNLPSIGYQAGDKPEGLTMLPDGRLAVLNDNDFGLLDEDIPVDGTVPVNPDPTPVVLGIIDFPEGNQLDASNRDGGINIKNHPVLGMYQPDAIDSFEVDDKTYYITANEGDARDYDGFSEETRVKDLTLDPTAYPDAATLQEDENLGRLKTTTTLGDYDGDGDVDQIFSYGGRSFTIWDEVGNLVFDSGDQIAKITAEQIPQLFNANDGDPGEFDQRSDDKGAEPESVTVGMVDGKPYAFIGLERTGGVLVYDVSDPTAPVFNQYITTEGDIAPEGLKFIAAEDSPNGKPVLAVANEESNTTTLYEIAVSDFTLQLLHTADQEGGIPALEDAPNFSAVLNALKNEDADGDGNVDYENTLTLSSGDAYIPGIFLDASADESLGDLLGKEGVGRADIAIQNELGFQAIALGNHEFDLGTEFVASVIAPDEGYPGASFPYLSANLDVSTDENLAPLVAADGQEASDIAGKIAKSAIVTVNGEKIGVVGATTPTLASISSPGDVTVKPEDSADIDALAAEIQASVDALLDANPELDKVVLLSHMQQISIEEELATKLKNVDIIMAGGSNTRLVDETDRLRDGDTAQGVYPILKTDADGKPVAVINTDGNYKYVGRLVVDFDANGNIIPGSINPNVSGAYATDDAGVAAVNGTPDAEIVEITEALSDVIEKLERNFFGITDVFLNGTRSSVRTEETNLGNLTADANLAIAKQTDPSVVISIKNGGGIRDNIGRVVTPAGSTEPEFLPPEANELAGKPEGGISQVDIQDSLRFNNGLTLLTATAEELLAIIEYGVAETEDGATPGRFPQVSGLKFSFNDDLPAGDRVQSLAVVDENGEVIDVIAKDGELQGDTSRTFRLVTLDFLANGGDGYPFPARDVVELKQEDTAARTGAADFAVDGSEQDALAEFLAANFSEENPFSEEDVAAELDMRIQNLDFREDTVLGDIASTPIITQEVDGTTVEAIDLTGFDAQPTVAVNYTITREAAFDNEVYFYAVDDITGTVNGVEVGAANYAEEALKELVSAKFSTTDGNTESGTLEFNAGSIVVPVIIADGTFAEALSGAAEVYFPYLGANSDGFDHIRFNDTTNTFEFEDLPGLGDGDFNDITIQINGIA